MQYRKEIDGLRAVAVLPVLFFHAGVSFIPGGFLGVDIFFVISGFLITGIIAEELKQSKFSIINFYERRCRRILPALFFVMGVTTIFAYLMLSPIQLKDYSQSVVSVTAFVSNIYFYLTNGYFTTASEELPLLHTWSLAVEEQYYLFFPVLMALLWRTGRIIVVLTLVLLSIVSLLGPYTFSTQDASANFYLIFSRAWELFAGSIAALLMHKVTDTKQPVKESLSLLGMGMLIFSLLVITKEHYHPGFITLIPVIGSVLVIMFAQHTLVGSFLQNPAFVWFGLISYSLYLWHQPVFAFLRIKSLHEPTAIAFSIALLVSIALAYFSLKVVEKPFRNKKFLSQKQVFIYSLIGLGLFMGVGLLGHINKGFPERISSEINLESMAHSPMRYECHTRGINFKKPDNACRYFGENATWAVMGDSHGVEIAYALAEKIKAKSDGVEHFTFSACPPAYSFNTPVSGCSQWNKEVIEYLVQANHVKQVLLTYRHTSHLYKKYLPSEIPDNFDPDIIDLPGLNASEKHQAYWESFSQMVQALTEAGKKVYILNPVPELEQDITKLVMPISILSDWNRQYAVQATTLAHYNLRNDSARDAITDIAKTFNAVIIEPKDALCNQEYCSAIKGQNIWYFDNNHLSVAGAKQVLSLMPVQTEQTD